MTSGYVGILDFELHFPDGRSLKAKRKHLLATRNRLERLIGASVGSGDMRVLRCGMADVGCRCARAKTGRRHPRDSLHGALAHPGRVGVSPGGRAWRG